MRVHFITPDSTSRIRPQLEAFHRLRHEIFIGAVGRPDLHSVQKWEYDIWDTPLFDAVRVLLENDEGEPIGVARLVCSTELTMLEANHQEFMTEMHDKRSDLWEIQRLGIRLDMHPREMERAILFLLSEITLWGMENGIKDVMLLTYSGIAKKRLEDMDPMGPEHMLVGAPHLAMIGTLERKSVTEWMERFDALTLTPAERSAA